MAVGVPSPSTRAEWLRYAGRNVTVLAPPASFAATRAPQVLQEAERTIAELQRILAVPARRAPSSVDILLVDAAPPPAGLPVTPPAAAPVLSESAGPPLLRMVSPEATSEALAHPMTRALVAQWFGPQAAAAETVVRGLGGLAAAAVGTGPSRADADAWVQARLADRTLPSLFTGPPPVAATPRRPPSPTEPGTGDPALDRLRNEAVRTGFHVALVDAAEPRLVEIPDGRLVVGRDPASDLVLDDGKVSRRHAVLTVRGDSLELRDAGSRNGTRVNGETVQSTEVHDGDRIAVGRAELVVLRVDAASPAGGNGVPPGAAPGAEAPGSGADAQQPAGPGADLALTSFAGFLLDGFGAEAVREFLSTFDPDRHDRAAVSVFHTPLGALEEAWHARQAQRAAGGAQVRAFVAQIVPLLAPHRKRIVELTVLMLLATVNTIALPLGFRYFVDHILPSRSVHDLIVFTGVLSGFFLAGNLIALRRTYVASRLSEQIGVQLQERMFEHMQRMSHRFYMLVRGGDLLSRFTRDLTIVQQALVILISGGVALIISAAAAFVTLALLNVYIAVLVASVLPLYVISHMVLHTRFRTLSYERQQQAGDATAVLQETTSAHDLIKAYGGEDRALDAYRVRLDRMLATAYRLVMTGAGLQASVGMMAAIAQIEVLCLGGYLVMKGHLSIGTLLAAISLAPAVLQPVNQLSQTTQSAQAAAGSMSRIQELLDEPPGIVDKADAVEIDTLGDEIAFEDVTLAYGPGRPALDSLSLKIPIGAHVAFVGPSGAGKTSLLNLLLRFWDPTSGRVLLDGHDMRDVSVGSLRRQFGVILQDTFIFNTTVRANIAFGRPDATDEQVVAAAQAAQLHDFIATLPAGYETVLGDRGVRMSGGQRQRLAIARALLREPAVLILDEATSALDARTEADLRRSLAAAGAGRTVVSISHRLTSIVDSDRIFVLAAGRLAEDGTHEELLAADGLYRQLWSEQQGGGEPAAVPMGVGASSALAAVPLLARVPPAVLDDLARVATRERYGAGSEVAGTDEPIGRLLVVVEGELEFAREAPDGSRMPAERFGPGDFVGELALVQEQRLPAPLRAMTAVRLLALERTDFLAVAKSRPELQRAVLAQLAGRRAALASAASASGVDDNSLSI
ncbi:MAG: ATP-binding cassette, subfamily bacterial [Solirubrobacteraceae bacterium]|nr:ATP-binding cassette, subfamily bacterial [Solirubrobacteraceae bacterium]